MVMAGFSLLSGLGTAIRFGNAYRADREIQQGHGYDVASIEQVHQVNSLFYVGSQLVPLPLLDTLFFQGVAFLGIPFAGFVRTGTLPRDERTVLVATFLSEHLGDIAYGGMIVGAVALIAMGNVAMGTGLLGGLAYGILERRNYLSQRVRLVFERYAPIIGAIGMIGCGGIAYQAQGIYILLTTASSSINRRCQHLFERSCQRVGNYFFPQIFGFWAARLEEMEDTPHLIGRAISAETVVAILTGEREVELDLTHCSRLAVEHENVPRNYEYRLLLEMFSAIRWEDKYGMLLRKVTHDERFLAEHERPLDVDAAVTARAFGQGVTKELYLANWATEQMRLLTLRLAGEIVMEGRADRAEEARDFCARLIHRLSLMGDEHRVTKEDALLKLAVEGGAYCSLGVMRAAKEIEDGFVFQDLAPDPLDRFELKVKIALERHRQRGLQMAYYPLAGVSPRFNDVHVHNFYRTVFELGLVPTSETDRREISLAHIFGMACLSPARTGMLSLYQATPPGMPIMDAARVFGDSDVTEQGFIAYMTALLGSNPHWSEGDKLILQEYWDNGDHHEQFQKVLFVMLGVFKLTLEGRAPRLFMPPIIQERIDEEMARQMV